MPKHASACVAAHLDMVGTSFSNLNSKLTSATDELNVRMQAKISSSVVVLKLYIFIRVFC